MDACGLDAGDFGDGTGQVGLLRLTQPRAFDRPAGTHRQIPKNGIGVGQALRQPLCGQRHLGAVEIGGRNLDLAGHAVEARFDPRSGQRVDDAGFLGLGHPGIERHSGRFTQEDKGRHGQHRDGQDQDGRHRAAHCGLLAQTQDMADRATGLRDKGISGNRGGNGGKRHVTPACS